MSESKGKTKPDSAEPGERPSRTPIETRDWDSVGTEEVLADDELAITGIRQSESEDAGDVSEDDDDNPYQDSDEALPDDQEEAEIAVDPEREGRRFGD